MFIGYYNLANIVTLTGLISSLLACFVAFKAADGEMLNKNLINIAVALFLLSGLCDMFDGRIARGSGSRTRKEKLFGIQIDSLCDMVSFGITPVIIAYCAGFNSLHHIVIYCLYAACGAIRLGYFNTQAVEETEDLNMKFFTGVPIPVCCLTLPPLMLVFKYFTASWVGILFALVYLFTGIAFIVNVRIPKMNVWQCIVLVICELISVVFLFLVN